MLWFCIKSILWYFALLYPINWLLIFHRIGPLGRFSLVIAMSIYMGRFCMTAKWPNPGLFYSDCARLLWLSWPVERVPINSHGLDRHSQLSQIVGLKKVQITQLSPSQIKLERLISQKKFSKFYNSLTVRAQTKLSNLHYFGSYK